MLSLMILALDVGGVNIKAASLKVEGEASRLFGAATYYFPIWRMGRERLPEALERVKQMLGVEPDVVALTMTAELSDAYQTKREGVGHIIASVTETYKKPVKVLNSRSSLVSEEEALKSPLEVAGANWAATAWMAGQILKNCVLIDTGSTTTDIIPVVEGRPAAKGLTDLDRLRSGELVYTGALRTNLAAIAQRVPVKGSMIPVASELFATSGDIHLILRHIRPEEFTVETADGRGKSLEEAYARLARLVCSDIEMLDRKTLDGIARYIYRRQLEQIVRALRKVSSNMERSTKNALTIGIGRRFLARPAALKVGLKPFELTDILSLRAEVPEAALALALLLASSLLGVKPIWML